MRVLFSTTAGSGHFGPLVPFARACVAADHEVIVAAPASFASEVRAAGFEHRPFADVPPELLGAVFGRLSSLSVEEANAIVIADVFGRLAAQAALPDLVAMVDEWRPDIVVREQAEYGSLVAARSAGVPQAVVAIGMTEMTDICDLAVAAPLAELDALAGLPEGAAAAVLRGSSTLTCVPAVLDRSGPTGGTGNGSIHRYLDDSLATRTGALPPAWGDPSQPLVYVSFGSVTAGLGDFGDLYPAVLAAFADQPVRVLLTTGRGVNPADLAPLPANAHVERWWPQPDVMPHAAAMVGHGGFGTTMTALAAGVPQVVVPLFTLDQSINGNHVAAVGAGLNLDGGPMAIPVLAEAVERLVAEPAYRTAAKAVADEMEGLPPVAEAVSLLELLARP
jgi:UDP:flavonoid glycosyltransferase YjiC (YdhE family)